MTPPPKKPLQSNCVQRSESTCVSLSLISLALLLAAARRRLRLGPLPPPCLLPASPLPPLSTQPHLGLSPCVKGSAWLWCGSFASRLEASRWTMEGVAWLRLGARVARLPSSTSRHCMSQRCAAPRHHTMYTLASSSDEGRSHRCRLNRSGPVARGWSPLPGHVLPPHPINLVRLFHATAGTCRQRCYRRRSPATKGSWLDPTQVQERRATTTKSSGWIARPARSVCALTPTPCLLL
jgi:hypothetical protein